MLRKMIKQNYKTDQEDSCEFFFIVKTILYLAIVSPIIWVLMVIFLSFGI